MCVCVRVRVCVCIGEGACVMRTTSTQLTYSRHREVYVNIDSYQSLLSVRLFWLYPLVEAVYF